MKAVRRFAARILTCVLLAIPVVPGVPIAQEAPAPDIRIPNFWGPEDREERPADGVVTGIRFVTANDFPPFNFVDDDGRLTGFNVDLARAICDALAVRCTIQARPWDDLLPSLGEDRADAAIAGIAITPETREKAGFSSVYLRMPGRFVVRKGFALPISPAALARRSIAVVAGSAHEAYLRAFFPNSRIRPFDGAQAARAALRAGEADTLFGDGVQLAFWLQGEASNSCCVFTGGPYIESRFFGEGMAVAVRPEATELRRAIDWALATLAAEGTYAELYLRYFPIGFY